MEFALNVRSDRRADVWNAGVNGKSESAFKMFLFGKCSRMLPFEGQIQTDGNKQHCHWRHSSSLPDRVAELANGFGSKLANEEIPFMVLEGAMIVLATVMMMIFHPGGAFGAKWTDAGWNWENDCRADVEDGRNSSSLS